MTFLITVPKMVLATIYLVTKYRFSKIEVDQQ